MSVHVENRFFFVLEPDVRATCHGRHSQDCLPLFNRPSTSTSINLLLSFYVCIK